MWLQGDNLADSTDSRYYGPVPMALIQGVVFARVYASPGWIPQRMPPPGQGEGGQGEGGAGSGRERSEERSEERMLEQLQRMQEREERGAKRSREKSEEGREGRSEEGREGSSEEAAAAAVAGKGDAAQRATAAQTEAVAGGAGGAVPRAALGGCKPAGGTVGDGGAVGGRGALLPSQSRPGEASSDQATSAAQLGLPQEQATRATREAAPPASPPASPPVASPAADGEAAATTIVAAERVWRRGDDSPETMAAAAVFIKAAQDAKVLQPKSRPPPNL